LPGYGAWIPPGIFSIEIVEDQFSAGLWVSIPQLFHEYSAGTIGAKKELGPLLIASNSENMLVGRVLQEKDRGLAWQKKFSNAHFGPIFIQLAAGELTEPGARNHARFLLSDVLRPVSQCRMIMQVRGFGTGGMGSGPGGVGAGFGAAGKRLFNVRMVPGPTSPNCVEPRPKSALNFFTALSVFEP
jgi:hypothetical protein